MDVGKTRGQVGVLCDPGAENLQVVQGGPWGHPAQVTGAAVGHRGLGQGQDEPNRNDMATEGKGGEWFRLECMEMEPGLGDALHTERVTRSGHYAWLASSRVESNHGSGKSEPRHGSSNLTFPASTRHGLIPWRGFSP